MRRVASKYAKPVSSEFIELHSSQPCLERRGNGLPLAIAGKHQRNGKAGPWLTSFVLDSFSPPRISRLGPVVSLKKDCSSTLTFRKHG